jgi:hypothetical protein
MNRLSIPAALVLSASLAGCVTVADTDQQQLEVHTILDHREVAGVGCLLANDIGRWFVVAPGRVTVTRSSKPMAVTCRHATRGSADEWWASRYDNGKLIGNLAIDAGLRDTVGRYAGDGFSYPATITVYMRMPKAGELDGGRADPGSPVY